ncbi:hypothetical protein PSACC_01870 [Paramicrosporidium saccamoebae]|uniref:Uncharacterized protein n=1 Tax=Paramicrosporidium saccamoebae TaxID=1246581 RepID=A0A2H9TKR5_9FUNG|nr:hypothetical protein PSACC_01870 [Paramicrosporidium saccamoebae]
MEDRLSCRDPGPRLVSIPVLDLVNHILLVSPSNCIIFQLLTSDRFIVALTTLLISPILEERVMVLTTARRIMAMLARHNLCLRDSAKVLLTQVGLALTDVSVKPEVTLRPIPLSFELLLMTFRQADPTFIESFYVNYLLPFLRTSYLEKYLQECSMAVMTLINWLEQTDLPRANRCLSRLLKTRFVRRKNANWEASMVQLIFYTSRWTLSGQAHILLLRKMFRVAAETPYPQLDTLYVGQKQLPNLPIDAVNALVTGVSAMILREESSTPLFEQLRSLWNALAQSHLSFVGKFAHDHLNSRFGDNNLNSNLETNLDSNSESDPHPHLDPDFHSHLESSLNSHFDPSFLSEASFKPQSLFSKATTEEGFSF